MIVVNGAGRGTFFKFVDVDVVEFVVRLDHTCRGRLQKRGVVVAQPKKLLDGANDARRTDCDHHVSRITSHAR